MDLYQAALGYVARYAASRENLRRVLWRKLRRHAQRNGEPAPERADAAAVAEIEAAIGRLEALGILNDEAFAAAQTRTLRARGASVRAIRARLSAKGLKREQVEQAIAAETPESRDLEAARILARRRRLGPYRQGEPRHPDQRRRDLAAVCRAGFSIGIATQVIDGSAE